VGEASGSDIGGKRGDRLPQNGDKPMANILIARPTSYRPDISTRALQVIAWLELCQNRWHERRQLESLDDNALKDIGLSRADVEREINRWPWEGPRRLV
jgi:uncharacterized protein YjiS (DUF1127 family)